MNSSLPPAIPVCAVAQPSSPLRWPSDYDCCRVRWPCSSSLLTSVAYDHQRTILQLEFWLRGRLPILGRSHPKLSGTNAGSSTAPTSTTPVSPYCLCGPWCNAARSPVGKVVQAVYSNQPTCILH